MITIKITASHINITGHTQADICASVSCIMYSHMKLLEKYNNKSYEYTDSNDIVDIILTFHDEMTDMIWDNMVECFAELFEDAPKGTVILTKDN